MTKGQMKEKLQNGATMEELFEFTEGQECEIFKSDFRAGDEIIYIPDLCLNEIPTGRPVSGEELDDVLGCCYTGNDFIEVCDGNEEKAKYLFGYCDWQHPSSAVDEIADDED